MGFSISWCIFHLSDPKCKYFIWFEIEKSNSVCSKHWRVLLSVFQLRWWFNSFRGKNECVFLKLWNYPKANKKHNTHRGTIQSDPSAQYSPRVVAPKNSHHPEVGLCWHSALPWRKDVESASNMNSSIDVMHQTIKKIILRFSEQTKEDRIYRKAPRVIFLPKV